MNPIIFIILLIPSIFIHGFAVMTMWGWFIVPLGVMALTLWHSLGLALTTYYISGGLHNSKTDTDTDNGLQIVKAYVAPLIVLAVGYLYNLGM